MAASGGARAHARDLLIERRSACGEDGMEDAVSMALAASWRLMNRCGVVGNAIGQLQVGGGASLLDRSKSIKSELMALFEVGSTDAEGIDSCGPDAMVAVANCSR